jgi:hypothetical protein
MSYTKKYDYRREFINLTLSELKDRLTSLQGDFDKWFVHPFGDEEADKVWRKITYVKQRIHKIES